MALTCGGDSVVAVPQVRCKLDQRLTTFIHYQHMAVLGPNGEFIEYASVYRRKCKDTT